MRKVLVIRHHLEDDAGLVGEAFVARGFELSTSMIDAENAPPKLADAEAVIVLGSNSSVYDLEVRRTWFDRELEYLAEVDRAGVPMLCICFGAQALCTLFGGQVVRAPQGELGWYEVDVVAPVALPSGPWFEHHGDRCVLPGGTALWATTSRAAQAFTFGRHLGVQFHPEIDDAQLARWFAHGANGSRAQSDHEAALLEETRRETPGARLRASQLVDLFLEHAKLN